MNKDGADRGRPDAARGSFSVFARSTRSSRGEYGGHDLAETALNSEWAGATFSRDGAWLFLNIYSPGVTVAITGPWQDGYL